MRKYALLNNNIVTEVLDLEDNQVQQKLTECNLIIDIEDTLPQPEVGWLLQGNQLVPFEALSQEKLEEALALKKMEKGNEISKMAIKRVGAKNKLLNKTTTQITTLLSTLAGIKALLETGALGTARSNIILVKAGYPEYAEIFQESIDAINDFEAKYGL